MMKKRILSILLALVLTAAAVPAMAVSAEDGCTVGTGYTTVYGGNTGYTQPSAGFQTDNSVDYCSILGISKATAEKFSEQVRESLRRWDFNVEISGIKIKFDNSDRQINAFFAMVEHEVFYQFDTFMFTRTSYDYYRDSNNYLTSIKFIKSDATYTYDDYLTYLNASRMVAENMMEGIKDNKALTHLQKALLLHDRLAAWTRYDIDNFKTGTIPDASYSAVGALWNQLSVCQGYAEAYAYMLDQCGIPNRMAQSTRLNHVWNIVTIEGAEYYVDVTWDDPSEYDLYGQVLHDNFMVSLTKLKQNHDANDFAKIKDNTTFDNWFWTESHAEFQLVGDSGIYYLDNVVDGAPTHAALCQWAGNNLYEVLRFNSNEDMSWTWNNGGVWDSSNYACLDGWDGKLYVNVAKKIYEYDPSAATWRVCFAPQLSGYNCIYGFTIWNGRFMMNFLDTWPTSGSQWAAQTYYYDLRTIASVSVVKKPTVAVYKKNSGYDFRGLTLQVNYTDGSSVEIKNYVHAWTGGGSGTTGTKTFTVTLFDKTADFTVKVISGLSKPTVTVKNADKGVAISWKKVSNATTYVVYRSYKKNGKWTDWAKVTTTSSTAYTNASAKAGTVYRYAVRAYAGDVKSSLGESGEIRRLATPTVSRGNAEAGIKVAWKKVTGAKKYTVYRSRYKDGKWSSYTQIKTTTATSYTDKTASANTQYRYAVKAVNGSQKSASGTCATIRRLKSVSATAKKSGTTIKVTWKKVSGGKKYVVYRRLKGASSWTKMTTTTKLTYTDKTAKKGKYYEYSVRAVNGDSLSAHKATKKVKR